jgi:hypothetical protein
LRSQLVKLEREISRLIGGRIVHRSHRAHLGKKRRQTASAGYAKLARDRLSVVAASFKIYGRAIAGPLHKLLAAIRRPSIRSIAHKPRVAVSQKHAAPSNEKTIGKTINSTGVLLAVCFGLVSISSILLVAALLQIRDMKSEIARWEQNLAGTKARLAKSESLVQQLIARDPSRAINQPQHAANQPQHAALTLSEADKKMVRQFIKFLPPQPGAKPKIQLGDEISSRSSAPIPQELIDQLPKLRGARFSIDQDGTIVIVGEGSSHADVLIARQQIQ